MGLLDKTVTVLREELAGVHPRLTLVQGLVRLIPNLAGIRARRWLYRLAGVQIGRGTTLFGHLVITGTGPVHRRLEIGQGCIINAPIHLNLGASIRLGDGVAVGPYAVFVTDSHQLGDSTFRAGEVFSAPIEVGDGAWIGTGAMLLPGVRVGPGAVVAAGAVVVKDVPADTLVAGVPARPFKELCPAAEALRRMAAV